MTEDSFGFTAASKTTADKLRSIKPSLPQTNTGELERTDKAGEALGFVSREPSTAKVVRRRREIGPTVAINTRAPERVADPFIQFCEENRYSYWEGIEELMKRAGVL